MSGSIDMMKCIYGLFSQGSIAVPVGIILLLALTLFSSNRLIKNYIAFPSIIILVFINNPLSIKWIVESGIMIPERFVRVYWLIPFVFIFAYVFSMITTWKKNQIIKMPIAVILVLFIVFMGKYMFTEDVFTPMANLYKIPQDAIDVCELIEEDVSKQGKDIRQIRTVVPSSLESYIRQYDANIKLLYGRNETVGGAEYIRELMKENELMVDELTSGCLEFKCYYIVVDKTKPKVGDFESGGYKILGETDNYSIYKIKKDFN